MKENQKKCPNCIDVYLCNGDVCYVCKLKKTLDMAKKDRALLVELSLPGWHIDAIENLDWDERWKERRNEFIENIILIRKHLDENK